MKKTFALILSTIMVLTLLAGCGFKPAEPPAASSAPAASASQSATTEPEEEKVKCTAVLLMAGSAAWGATRESLLRGYEEFGWDGEVLAPAVPLDEEEMIKFAESAISGGSDVLITTTRHGDMWVDTCKRAHDAGMIVIGVGVKPDRFGLSEPYKNEDLIDSFVGADISEVSRLQAQAMHEVIPADVPVNAIMFYPEVNDAAKMCYEVIQEEFLKLRPDAKFHSIQAENNDSAMAADKLAAVRLADPTVNVVFGMGAYDALGVHTYIVENNLQGQIYASGVDASPESLGTVKAGTVSFIIDQGYSSYGEDCIKQAIKIMNGEPYDWEIAGTMAVVGPDIVEEWSVSHGFGEVPEL